MFRQNFIKIPAVVNQGKNGIKKSLITSVGKSRLGRKTQVDRKKKT